MDVAVIGSGLAGLTAGATLARAGHKVRVYEQFERPGGVTAPYEQAGFKWDLGQLLIEGLGPDEPVGRVLAALGVADRIRVRVDDRGYVFPDFALPRPVEYAGVRWRMERLKQLFPSEAAGLERYWRAYLRFTRVMTCARRREAAEGGVALYWKTRLYWELLPLLPQKDWSAQRLMESTFRSEKLRLVFLSILADFFTAPEQFMGLGVFALNPEASFDCRMPRQLARGAEQLYHYSILGGISTLVEALVGQIRAHGGEVCTSLPVRRIVVAAGRVTGVEAEDGSQMPAHAVVASGGAQEVFFDLVGSEHLPPDFSARLRALPLMGSVFMLHLGLDADPGPAVQGVCTYYYGTYDLAGVIAEAHAGIYHEGRAGFVVHLPSRHSPEMAPPGCHAMTIYTICPDRLKEASWSERKEILAERLLDCAEQRLPGLRAHIRQRTILTPEDFRRRTHTARHAFGGLAPVMGAWRPPHKTPLQGLWFVGAQSESGGGVNNVIPAAYRTARRLMAEN
jgi:phytoene dehydrogenase-like protein